MPSRPPTAAAPPPAPDRGPATPAAPWRRHVTTLVYAFDPDGRLCLVQRRKAPNAGLWSPPGGKLEPDETPLAGALRELAEETGLIGRAARLAVVVTEHDARAGEAWLMFCVRVDVDDPALGGDDREGTPAWVEVDAIPRLATPPADGHLLAAVQAATARSGVAVVDIAFDGGRLGRVDVRWA